MDFKISEIKYFLIKIVIIIIIILISVLYLRSKKISFEISDSCDKIMIDYELKNLDDCFLTIHNFIRLSNVSTNKKKNSFDADFKTYISSYSKPFLIQLLKNNTENCLCCENCI